MTDPAARPFISTLLAAGGAANFMRAIRLIICTGRVGEAAVGAWDFARYTPTAVRSDPPDSNLLAEATALVCALDHSERAITDVLRSANRIPADFETRHELIVETKTTMC